jgi:quercetin dioxygenase-like cupin family protein
MEIQRFNEVARFDPDKFVHVPIFSSDRTKVLLLCLSPGLSVPPHSHPGYEVTLQPLRGKANLPLPDGSTLLLEPGMFITLDGASAFNPSNPFNHNFEMLIHLIRAT